MSDDKLAEEPTEEKVEAADDPADGKGKAEEKPADEEEEQHSYTCCEKMGFDSDYWENTNPMIWLPKWIGINLVEAHPSVDMVTYNERSCTDCPCLIVFWAGVGIQIFMLLMFIAPETTDVLGWKGKGAHITTLFRGTDYHKHICMCDACGKEAGCVLPPGVDPIQHKYEKDATFWQYDKSGNAVEVTKNGATYSPCLQGKPYAAFPDPRTPNLMLCLSNCTQTVTDPRMVGFIPTTKIEIKTLATQAFQQDEAHGGEWKLARRYGYPTKMAMNSYCIPDYKKFTGIAKLLNDTAQSLGGIVKVIEEIFGGAIESANRAVGDLMIAKFVLFSAAGIALIGAFGYMYIIRAFGSILVIVAMFGTAIGGAFLAFTLYSKAETALEWGFIMMYQIMHYGSYIIMAGVLFILMTIFGMWDNIMKAVEIAKESSRAVQDMSQILLVPFVNAFMILGYLIFWFIVFFAAMAVAPTTSMPLPMAYWPPNFCSYPGMAIKSALYSAGEYNAMLACSRLFNGNQCFWDVAKKRCEAGTVNKYIALTHRGGQSNYGGTICETFSRGKAGNTDLSASRAKSLCDGQYSRQCFWVEATKKCKSKCPLRWLTSPPGDMTVTYPSDYVLPEVWTKCDACPVGCMSVSSSCPETTKTCTDRECKNKVIDRTLQNPKGTTVPRETDPAKGEKLTPYSVQFRVSKEIDIYGVPSNETAGSGAVVGGRRACTGYPAGVTPPTQCYGTLCRSQLNIEIDEWAYYLGRMKDNTIDGIREQPYMNFTGYGCSDLRCAFERHAIGDANSQDIRCKEGWDGQFWLPCVGRSNTACKAWAGSGIDVAKHQVREVPCYAATGGGNKQKLFLFAHFFLMLWAVNFIDYMSYSAKSGAFAAWYFSDWDPDRTTRKIQGGWDGLGDWDETLSKHGEDPPDGRCRRGYGYFPVVRSFMRNIRFHMGTNSFAGCLIAILQTMQLILLYVQYKCKDAEHPALQYALLCASFCLQCMKDCFDKMNQGALIFTQIYGKPFLAAGLDAFLTQVKHLGTSILMIMVSTYVAKIGIVVITAFTAGVALMICQYHPALKELTSYVLVCVVCAMIGFLVAQIFMSIYQSAIDTIYLCFLVDMDHHNGVPQHASMSFKGIFDKQKDKSQNLAETDDASKQKIENAEENAEEYEQEKADAAAEKADDDAAAEVEMTPKA